MAGLVHRMLRYLGAGEFCTVWRARLEGGEVAVKLLKEEHNNNHYQYQHYTQ